MLRQPDRTKDMNEKIQLGGLVVKAGLRHADRAFLLGILVAASQQLDNENYVRDMVGIGKKAFAIV